MRNFKSFSIIFIIIVLLVFQSTIINADSIKDLSSETLAISLIIDTSGSMNTTDPKRLRETTANVFIDLLNPEDYLSIITFNSYVDLVIPMEQLKDNSIRETFKQQLSSRLESSSNTDYKAAFDKANEELSKLNDPNVRKVIIFLTDGEPEPDKIIGDQKIHMEKYMKSLWETVSELSKKNYPVYSIGFSDGIDVKILEKIAEETTGDVRIFKDAADLDENLIQILKSREIIATELLAQQTSTIRPSLSTDFWLKEEGYRKGEDTVVSASINLGNNRLQSGIDLTIDKFNLIIKYDDGIIFKVPLLDDGGAKNGDIKANDGIWSNKIFFKKIGEAEAKLEVWGKLKNESFNLEKLIGEYIVDEPGNILLSSYAKNLWIKEGEVLTIPLKFNNESSFKEVVFINIDEKIGTTDLKQIELGANSKSYKEIKINLNPSLNRGIYDFKIDFKALNNFTTIDNIELSYRVEIVSFFESISRTLKNRSIFIIPILAFFIGLPLLMYFMGILLYFIIVKPQTKVKGTLTYWEEDSPDNKTRLELTKKKKNKIIISFDSLNAVDFHIENSKFKYDIEISNEFIKKRKKFIQGWMALITKKTDIFKIIKCTKPGIIIHDGDICTSLTLYGDEEFTSGGFCFHFTIDKPKWTGRDMEGKNILEGKI